MKVAEFVKYDAVGLAELIRARAVSAAEVQEASRRAIEQVNPQLNALVAPLFERPLAHDADGPFGGVPFVIKDVGLHARDVPQRMGSRLTGPGLVFPYDTDLMTRFRAAGMATLGVTSTPEFGFNFSTEPVANGPTRNPWDPTRTPGGSSGGSAALVAARAVPVAHANDGAGSIRCPASWCGLVGLKPSRGRTPVGPDQADPILGCGIEFVLARTVRDCAGLLDAVAGAGIGERYVLPPPVLPYHEEARRAPGRLRIAVTTTPWHDAVVDKAHVETVSAVARHLASLGHEVAEARPDLDAAAFDDASVKVWATVEASWALNVAAARNVAPGRETLEATMLACLERARSVSALELVGVQQTFNAITRQIAHWFEGWDVLVTPTMAIPPPALGYLNMDDPEMDVPRWWRKLMTCGPFTALWNVTGAPALSLPLGMTPAGLPIGVQFVGRYLDESTLVRLAAQIEQTMPWIERTPSVHAA